MASRKTLRTGLELAASLALLAPGLAAGPDENENARLFQPAAVYQSHERRDPFVRPSAERLSVVLNQVDIAGLQLSGLISLGQNTVALFVMPRGPRFGFLLRGGLLYRDNRQAVPGITGQVMSAKQVVLRQNGREIAYQLK